MAITQDSTHESGVSDNSPTGGSSAQRARERKAHAALALKRDGSSWLEIAETLGFPTPRAALVAVERALEEGMLSVESQEFMRRLAGMKLEEWMYAISSKAGDDQHPEQLAAIGKARDLLETHIKLFGYAAPQKVAIYNPLEGEVQEFVQEVLAQRAAGQNLQESDIFDLDPENDEDFELSTPASRALVQGQVVQPEPVTEPEPDKQVDF